VILTLPVAFLSVLYTTVPADTPGTRVTRQIDLSASQVAPIELVYTRQLIRRDSRGVMEGVLVSDRSVSGTDGLAGNLNRISAMINQSATPDLSGLSAIEAGLVRQYRALRERIRRESGAEAEIRLSFAVRGDSGRGLAAEGYRFAFGVNLPTPDGSEARITGYMRVRDTGDFYYGEARARIQIPANARQDRVGRITLALADPDIRFDVRDTPAQANADVLRVMRARFENDVKTEAQSLLQKLQGHRLVTDAEMLPLIAADQGQEVRLNRQVPYTWFGQPRQADIVVIGKVGRIIILDVPGPPGY